MEDITVRHAAGQAVSLIALVLCLVAFASKRDDRLLVVLIFANVALAMQFTLFGAWVAAGIETIVIVRIFLACRLKGSWLAMSAILAANVAVAGVAWEQAVDAIPLVGGILGTVAMFVLRGIPMRVLLALKLTVLRSHECNDRVDRRDDRRYYHLGHESRHNRSPCAPR